MKILDKIGLIVFADLILIISIILCMMVFGWLKPETVYAVTVLSLNDEFTTKFILGACIVLMLLAIKCIFFSTSDRKVNGIKDGILLKNDDGELVISKSTLEELVNSIVKGFDSAQNADTTIVLDEEKNLKVYVMISVKEDAIIKELTTNMQSKIKSTIKRTSDLEVKEVNISIRNLQQDQEKTTIE